MSESDFPLWAQGSAFPHVIREANLNDDSSNQKKLNLNKLGPSIWVSTCYHPAADSRAICLMQECKFNPLLGQNGDSICVCCGSREKLYAYDSKNVMDSKEKDSTVTVAGQQSLQSFSRINGNQSISIKQSNINMNQNTITPNSKETKSRPFSISVKDLPSLRNLQQKELIGPRICPQCLSTVTKIASKADKTEDLCSTNSMKQANEIMKQQQSQRNQNSPSINNISDNINDDIPYCRGLAFEFQDKLVQYQQYAPLALLCFAALVDRAASSSQVNPELLPLVTDCISAEKFKLTSISEADRVARLKSMNNSVNGSQWQQQISNPGWHRRRARVYVGKGRYEKVTAFLPTLDSIQHSSRNSDRMNNLNHNIKTVASNIHNKDLDISRISDESNTNQNLSQLIKDSDLPDVIFFDEPQRNWITSVLQNEYLEPDLDAKIENTTVLETRSNPLTVSAAAKSMQQVQQNIQNQSSNQQQQTLKRTSERLQKSDSKSKTMSKETRPVKKKSKTSENNIRASKKSSKSSMSSDSNSSVSDSDSNNGITESESDTDSFSQSDDSDNSKTNSKAQGQQAVTNQLPNVPTTTTTVLQKLIQSNTSPSPRMQIGDFLEYCGEPPHTFESTSCIQVVELIGIIRPTQQQQQQVTTKTQIQQNQQRQPPTLWIRRDPFTGFNNDKVYPLTSNSSSSSAGSIAGIRSQQQLKSQTQSIIGSMTGPSTKNFQSSYIKTSASQVRTARVYSFGNFVGGQSKTGFSWKFLRPKILVAQNAWKGFKNGLHIRPRDLEVLTYSQFSENQQQNLNYQQQNQNSITDTNYISSNIIQQQQQSQFQTGKGSQFQLGGARGGSGIGNSSHLKMLKGGGKLSQVGATTSSATTSIGNQGPLQQSQTQQTTTRKVFPLQIIENHPRAQNVSNNSNSNVSGKTIPSALQMIKDSNSGDLHSALRSRTTEVTLQDIRAFEWKKWEKQVSTVANSTVKLLRTLDNCELPAQLEKLVRIFTIMYSLEYKRRDQNIKNQQQQSMVMDKESQTNVQDTTSNQIQNTNTASPQMQSKDGRFQVDLSAAQQSDNENKKPESNDPNHTTSQNKVQVLDPYADLSKQPIYVQFKLDSSRNRTDGQLLKPSNMSEEEKLKALRSEMTINSQCNPPRYQYIIFLDVDGVLNTYPLAESNDPRVHLHHGKLRLLGDFIRDTYFQSLMESFSDDLNQFSTRSYQTKRIEIVLSSAWRLEKTCVSALLDVFYEVNQFPLPWIAVTVHIQDDDNVGAAASSSSSSSSESNGNGNESHPRNPRNRYEPPTSINALTARSLEIRAFCNQHLLKTQGSRWIVIDDLNLSAIQSLQDLGGEFQTSIEPERMVCTDPRIGLTGSHILEIREKLLEQEVWKG